MDGKGKVDEGLFLYREVIRFCLLSWFASTYLRRDSSSRTLWTAHSQKGICGSVLMFQ